jgi:putative peptide zinc metalloprotease protein
MAGRVVRLATAGPVEPGQLLFEVESPELMLSARRADGQRESSERELAGLSGLADGEQRRAQLQGQHDKYAAEASAFRDEAARLQLVAPFKGQLLDVDAGLAPGVWVAPRQALAVVIDPDSWIVEAFIPEADVDRIRPGDKARFHPAGQPFGILHGKVVEVDSTRSTSLPHPALDATSGGSIPTLPNQQHGPAAGRSPRESLYRVRILVDESPALQRIAVGEVRIAGEGRAWLPSAMNRIVAVGVRELGF